MAIETDAQRLARLDREAMRRGSASNSRGYIAKLHNFKNSLEDNLKPAAATPASATQKSH